MFSLVLTELLEKGAVKLVQDQDGQFVSTMFVLKQANKLRPIFNLKSLNRFVKTEKFKLESMDLVRTLLRKDDYFMKLDLKDAYYTVPMAQAHMKYLRFQLQGNTYEFQCLPFGLSSAPRAFTKLIKPIVALLRFGW
jgi:hypothetical protein